MKARNLTLFIAFILLHLLVFSASAQRRHHSIEDKEDRMEKIESARTAYLTDKLNLTPEQAQKFWPLYNEYNAKRKELKQKSRSFKGDNIETMSDKELKEGIENMFDTRQAELNLEKSYADKFQKVITTRQLALLYKGEREFTKVLLKRLENRKASK